MTIFKCRMRAVSAELDEYKGCLQLQNFAACALLAEVDELKIQAQSLCGFIASPACSIIISKFFMFNKRIFWL